ncbi:NAD(P)-binding domain-containing protein [Intrasporangium sp.]|uniref:imine reductase family protein n=1 Tax=Intrasporangium sp. TaxID=1925024 RepID=UPI00293A8636|nr:NAD(P)-binding domain-containing protein [Intrasporangium sp.]MDV3222240.1 NAD(P)-binding domain-containing protein [Intrasporangium sp.]
MNDVTTQLHPHHTTAPRRVTVLGLGAMGAALARALVAAEHDVVVWNRSPKDLARLGLEEARPAADPAAAVRDADVVLVCVLDHQASRNVIEQLAPALSPRVPVVNVSSGTPDQAVESAAAAQDLGVDYLTGAIMVPVPLIGTEDNVVLYAGRGEALAAARPVLDSLGGTVDVLGEDHSLPPVLDMAMLDVYFAGMYAFLHSAAMVRAHGIEPTAYLPYATGLMSTLTTSLPGLAQAYESHKYDGGEATIEMCLSFLNHIVATSEAAGVDARLPRLVRDATLAEVDRNPRGIDWDVVAEGLTDAR